MKTFTDSERILAVCEFLDKTPYKLAVELGYKNPSSIYHVRDKKANLSDIMAKKIVTNFPAVNYAYLVGKSDKIQLDESGQLSQQNFLATTTVKGATFMEQFRALQEDIQALKQQNIVIIDLLKRQQS